MNRMRVIRSAPTDEKDAAVSRELQRIPGIGPSLARDLADLGIRRVNALRGRSPERLYQRLCQLRGVHQDRCVLYTFRCAVYFATEATPDPEKLKWWNWQDLKKPTRNSRSTSSARAPYPKRV